MIFLTNENLCDFSSYRAETWVLIYTCGEYYLSVSDWYFSRIGRIQRRPPVSKLIPAICTESKWLTRKVTKMFRNFTQILDYLLKCNKLNNLTHSEMSIISKKGILVVGKGSRKNEKLECLKLKNVWLSWKEPIEVGISNLQRTERSWKEPSKVRKFLLK